MLNSKFAPILNEIKTVEEAEEFILQIELLQKNLYSINNISIGQLIDQSIGDNFSNQLKNLISQNDSTPESYELNKIFFEDLKKELEKSIIFDLTLAYHPTQDHIIRFKKWSISNINETIIFKIHYNPELIAGAVIIVKGHYLDYSAKNKFEVYLKNNKLIHITKNEKLQ